MINSKSLLGCHQIKSSQSGWQYSLCRIHKKYFFHQSNIVRLKDVKSCNNYFITLDTQHILYAHFCCSEPRLYRHIFTWKTYFLTHMWVSKRDIHKYHRMLGLRAGSRIYLYLVLVCNRSFFREWIWQAETTQQKLRRKKTT